MSIERKQNTPSGFSLIEVMVAMVIVGIIAIVSARSFVSLKQSEITLRGADVCRSYLDSAFKNIDLYGVVPTMVNTTVIPNTETTAGLTSGNNIKNAPMVNVFPLNSQTLVVYNDSSTSISQINTPVLLGGTIAMINGLYNQRASVCQAVIDRHGTDQIITAQPDNLLSTSDTDFQLTTTITPIDLSTGNVVAGCTPNTSRTLVPKSMVASGYGIDTTLDSPKKVAKFDPNVDNNTGFQVMLQSKYNTKDGKSHSCTASHNYSYIADFTPVGAPIGPATFHTTPAYSGTMTPAYGPDQVDVDISYTGKPGVVLFCKDASTAANPNDNPGNANFGNPYESPLSPGPGNRYVPCEHVTLCGKSQIRSGATQAVFTRSSATSFDAKLIWTNQNIPSNNQIPPWGCYPKLEVVAVDMSGNVSTTPLVVQGPLLGSLQDCHSHWGACVPSSPTACGAAGGVQSSLLDWPAMYGGANCGAPTAYPPVPATQVCDISATNPCAVNCVGSLGTCSAGCGGTTTYTITQAALNGGSSCPYANGQTIPCNGTCPSAPVDCAGAYGTCTGACGSQTQTYLISIAAANGGAACPVANGATQTCTSGLCSTSVNCVGAFGACSAGLQTYAITTPASGGGAACPYAAGATQACAAPPTSLCNEMCYTTSPAKPVAYDASTLGFSCTIANSFPSASSNCAGTYGGVTGFKGYCASLTCADFVASATTPTCPAGWTYSTTNGVCENTYPSGTCTYVQYPGGFANTDPTCSNNGIPFPGFNLALQSVNVSPGGAAACSAVCSAEAACTCVDCSSPAFPHHYVQRSACTYYP